jgi:hypothetical protein
MLSTLLSATGIKPGADLKFDGRDLLAVWQGKEKAPPRRRERVSRECPSARQRRPGGTPPHWAGSYLDGQRTS